MIKFPLGLVERRHTNLHVFFVIDVGFLQLSVCILFAISTGTLEPLALLQSALSAPSLGPHHHVVLHLGRRRQGPIANRVSSFETFPTFLRCLPLGCPVATGLSSQSARKLWASSTAVPFYFLDPDFFVCTLREHPASCPSILPLTILHCTSGVCNTFTFFALGAEPSWSLEVPSLASIQIQAELDVVALHRRTPLSWAVALSRVTHQLHNFHCSSWQRPYTYFEHLHDPLFLNSATVERPSISDEHPCDRTEHRAFLVDARQTRLDAFVVVLRSSFLTSHCKSFVSTTTCPAASSLLRMYA